MSDRESISSDVTAEPAASRAADDASADGEALAAGTEFGSYRIGDVIGRGAMGTVYRAQHRRLGKPVALKLMAPALRTSTEARQRFLLEAKTTAAIKHRHVIEIYDFGECGGDPYIVMELLAGEDLERFLDARRRLSAQEAANLLIPIAAALASAHDAGVVHRDLKPSNIFLHREPDGWVVPKLLDFGISKQTLPAAREDFRGTSWNQLLGSPHYLPPEAVNGCRDLTPRSDQYSLGVVLYESVTGRAPIERKTLFELLTAIAQSEFAPPSHGLPDLPGPMESLIVRCMQRDPEARFAHVRELGRALLELADARTQLLWGRAFDTTREAQATSEALVRVANDSPTLPPRGRPRDADGWRLVSLVAMSACVLAVGSVSLLAAAPPSAEIDRSFKAARDTPSPAAAAAPPATPLPPVPQAVVHLAESADGAAGSDANSPHSLEAATASPDEVPAARASKPAARAKRKTASPQRPPRLAGSARHPRQGVPGGTAAGDPSPPQATDAELGVSEPGPDSELPARDARQLGALGANESPILD